jgi:hypothetical protein
VIGLVLMPGTMLLMGGGSDVQDSRVSVEKFELNNAVRLFAQQTTTINSLWTVYVAATFAAAGYCFTASPLSPTCPAVTLDFCVVVALWSRVKWPAPSGTSKVALHTISVLAMGWLSK